MCILQKTCIKNEDLCIKQRIIYIKTEVECIKLKKELDFYAERVRM